MQREFLLKIWAKQPNNQHSGVKPGWQLEI